MKSVVRRFTALFVSLICSFQVMSFEVVDSLGSHEFAVPAKRVVALNWGATEELVELGVTPIGIADIEGYKTWVAKPALPEGSSEVGRRLEPSIESVIALQPDLIVIGSRQKNLLDRLARIAPVLYFDNYRADHKNAEVVDRSFVQLGKAVGKEQFAKERLQRRDDQIAKQRERLLEHFGHDIPKTSLVRFVDAAHVRIYGQNSMVEAALDGLGVAPAFDVSPSTWGQTQKAIVDLASIEDGAVLYIKPFPYEKQLFAMPLWQQMPFVKNGRVGAVASSWTYGGALSIEYLAVAITDALLALEP